MSEQDETPHVIAQAGLASGTAQPPEIGQDHGREDPAGEE